MDCKEAEELLPAYALNALSPEEEALVEAHLDACPWCVTILQEHREVTATLARAAELLEPSQRIKERTIRAAQKSNKRQGARKPLFTAGSLALGTASLAILLLAAVIAIGFYMSRQIDDLQQENANLSFQIIRLAEDNGKIMEMSLEQRSMTYILASPDSRVASLQSDESLPKAQGILMIAAQSGSGLLMAKGLEPLSEDQAYHVWLRKNGERVIVGRLSVDENGWGIITMWPEQPITLFEQVYVTADPAQGSEEPTTRPVLWGAIAPR